MLRRRQLLLCLAETVQRRDAGATMPTPLLGDEWRRRLEPTRVSLQSMTDGLRDSVEVFERILADPKLGTAARRQLEPMHALALFFAGRAKEAYAVVHRTRPPIPLRDQSDMLALITWELISCHTGEDRTACLQAHC